MYVDGVSIGPVGNYIFSHVTANHTIQATFAANLKTITAPAGPNGSISPSGAVGVDCGSNQTFTHHAQPLLPHRRRRWWTVVGRPAGELTFTNVTGPHSISASFAIDIYTMTASARAERFDRPSGAATVGCGSGHTYSIAADPGYQIADVLVDGASAGR